jgi:hypothetical protein
MAPKQQRVDFASIPISKEEREMDTEIEFAALSERLQEKELRPKKKDVQAATRETKEGETSNVVEAKG